MTDDAKSLALEAERLRTDRPFAEAVITIRKEAIEKMLSVDPADTQAVMNLQSYVRAIDALATEIGAQIIRGKPQRTNPVA